MGGIDERRAQGLPAIFLAGVRLKVKGTPFFDLLWIY